MNISKTLFVNLIRCERYSGLHETLNFHERAIISFEDDESLKEIQSQLNEEKKLALLENMKMFEIDEDPAKQDLSLKTEKLMEIYNQIEILAGKKIQKKYDGKVIYGKGLKNQKKISHKIEGYNFFTFVDAFYESEKSVNIHEVKATTSNKFLDIEYKNKNGKKEKMFKKKGDSSLYFNILPKSEITESYKKKLNKLTDKFSKIGRYIYDLAFQYCLYSMKKDSKEKEIRAYLNVLNSRFVFPGDYINSLPKYSDDIIFEVELTELMDYMMPNIRQDFLKVIERVNNNNASPVKLGRHCMKNDHRECKFYKICHKEIPEKNSIFTLIDRHHGFKNKSGEKKSVYDFINEGISSALEIPDQFVQRERNRVQIEVMKTKTKYFDKNRIRKYIDNLKYPIYHLDFESFPSPLPRFKGEKPYDQSVFQFSIHIEKTPGNCDILLDHRGYLATNHHDHREDLIKELCNIIGEDQGSVMVYHKQFEEKRIKEFMNYFPSYRDKLKDILNRIVDLKLFLKGNIELESKMGFQEKKLFNFYSPGLEGSFSIKRILPEFTDLSYENLEIKNGSEAFIKYLEFENMNDKEKKVTEKNLIEYCRQDTYAMHMILKNLRGIVYD